MQVKNIWGGVETNFWSESEKYSKWCETFKNAKNGGKVKNNSVGGGGGWKETLKTDGQSDHTALARRFFQRALF